MAAIGAGASTDWAGVSALVRYGETIMPNPAHAETYAQGYRQFRDLYQRLAPWFAVNGQVSAGSEPKGAPVPA